MRGTDEIFGTLAVSVASTRQRREAICIGGGGRKRHAHTHTNPALPILPVISAPVLRYFESVATSAAALA